MTAACIRTPVLAAGGEERVAGDPPGVFGGQEGRDRADVLGDAYAAQRDLGDERAFGVGAHQTGGSDAFGVGEACGDGELGELTDAA